MLVRRELPGDARAVAAVHADAFAPMYPGATPVEPGLVDALRADEAWLPPLSLVAEVDGEVVGHVCVTRATLGPDALPALGLGPLGVRERLEGRGVGSALVHAVLGAADALDEGVVVLLGHPDYYPRFGFRPAAELDIHPEVAEWAPHFQARPLTAYHERLRGTFRYAAPFGEL
ncbi:N-acetyltransferase [Pseudonocardia zijingensis]|uniref:N-acetyltransferase n=1 Tax=Pseudonocardia zijingensis TaxID=153376 RepID=A0ABN1PTV0_9PSEU